MELKPMIMRNRVPFAPGRAQKGKNSPGRTSGKAVYNSVLAKTFDIFNVDRHDRIPVNPPILSVRPAFPETVRADSCRPILGNRKAYLNTDIAAVTAIRRIDRWDRRHRKHGGRHRRVHIGSLAEWWSGPGCPYPFQQQTTNPKLIRRMFAVLYSFE